MKAFRNCIGLMLLLFVIAIGCTTSTQQTNQPHLGSISFPVTASDEAANHFEEGVLLLHSFMYSEAAESFQKAQSVDSDFAMAYWGEAMTKNHPLWTQQYYEPGQAILNKLASTQEERLAKAPTEFEKDMLMGAEILFGEGTKLERDDLYAGHMEKLYDKYPGNHEVAAFYALSLLGSVDEGRDYDVYGKGAKIAEGILAENPSHPGALHYLIHSYDDPDHAPLAIDAANNYSQVAPDAGHALHMPSHIYIAMGMWDEVISSNIRSYEARLKKNERTNGKGWNLHAYHWLLYGHLQKDERAKADTIMSRMTDYMTYSDHDYTKYYGIEMLGVYLAESDDWNGDFANTYIDYDPLNVQSKSAYLFIQGYQNYLKGDQESLEKIIGTIEEEIVTAANQLSIRGVTVCAGTTYAARAPNQDDIDISTVLVLELKAALGLLTQQPDENVEQLLKEATELEKQISFAFGPPAIVIPSYEMYGDWLLSKERYQEAIAQFDLALAKGPGRKKALEGKLKAAKGLGDEALQIELEKQLSQQLTIS